MAKIKLRKVTKGQPPRNYNRLCEVSATTDQPMLGDIARNDPDPAVRRLAIAMLTDQPSLGDVARNDPSWYVRLMAVKKLTDHPTLEYILQNDKNEKVSCRSSSSIAVILIVIFPPRKTDSK